MKKPILILSAILLVTIVLMSNVVLPAYANATPRTFETKIETQIAGYEVKAKRLDILQMNQWFVQLEAEVMVNGTRISIKSNRYPLAKIYQLFSQKKQPSSSCLIQSSGKIETLATATSSSTIPTYWWNNVEFVRAPGSSSTWVKYDHPNNYWRYRPGETNVGYTIVGSVLCHHEPVYAIQDAKFKSTFITIAAMCVPIIAGLLLVPELISKFTAAVVALFGAICALLGYAIRWFIENFVETELKDGWVYSWGHTKVWFLWWVIGHSWWMSLGSLRDWGFFLYVPL